MGKTFGSRAARLHLGSHPVAAELRDLDLAPAPLLALDVPQYTLISNRPDATIDVGDWRDPRGVYRDLRADVPTPVGSGAGLTDLSAGPSGSDGR